MKRSNSFVFALIFAELICVMGGFLLGKIAYQIKSKSDNNSVNVVISNDNYAVYDNFVAVLKDGKVYYNNSNDKHISVYHMKFLLLNLYMQVFYHLYFY